jgi:transcriptional regulator with XRE-family HTH domain
MTDVIKIAKQHRAKLAVEIAKMDDFIRMAEALIKYDQGLDRGPVIEVDRPAPGVPMADRGQDADRASENTAVRDGVARKVRAIEKPVAVEVEVEGRVADTSVAPDPTGNKTGESKINIIQVDSDHFAFNDRASAVQDELVLVNPLARVASPVDVHVGQRMRQRRWMMGITQKQLGDLVGVKFEKIKKYEAGTQHIRARRMWDIAVAMEVPMSYFFEGIEGQPADAGEARGEISTDKEAPVLVRGVPRARAAQAS